MQGGGCTIRPVKWSGCMKKVLISSVLALAVAGGAAGPALAKAAHKGGHAAHAKSTLQLKTEKVSLPGEGRGDYLMVDEASNRLFVTHTSTVHILDLKTLQQTGIVTGLVKAAGVALAAGKGFASDGDGNKIVVFDPATGNTIKVLQDGKKPDSILFDQASGMVLVFNGKSNSVTLVDPVKAEVVKTVALSDAPEYARGDGQGKVFVNLGEEHAIAVIDAVKGEVVDKFVMEGCEDPAALGIDIANHRLFSSCGNHVMKVVDSTNGKIVASLPVGEDPDGVLYDPANKRVIVGARDGAWTIVDQVSPNSYKINQVYKIDPYAKTLALDSATGRIFSSTADLVWPAAKPGVRLLPNAKSGTFRLMVVSKK